MHTRQGRLSKLLLVWAVCVLLTWVAPAYAGTPPLPVIPTNQFIITNFGALGNGVSNNASAIQKAIDAAGAAGGGTVIVAAVGVLTNYLSGPFNLTNSVCLQINSGTKLQMLAKGSWPNAATPFINGTNLHDVVISGSGTIDGQGAGWWPGGGTRPFLVNISTTTRLLIQNVTAQNSPMYHFALMGENVGVTVQGITVNTLSTSPNTDGIDITATNCLIQNCSISDGDDNISVKCTGYPSLDIVVSNCVFGFGHGVSMGSDTSGGIQNFSISNCSFSNTTYGIRMKSDTDRGGLVQNLTYAGLTMSGVQYPIVIYSYYNEIGTPNNITPSTAAGEPMSVTNSKTPIWRNILISNVTAVATTGENISGIIWGRPEMLVSNLTLCQVNIAAPTKTFCIYNAQDIQLIDSPLTAPNTTTNTLTLYNAQVTVTNTVPGTNLVTLGGLAIPPTNNTLAFFNVPATITDTNMLGTGSITMDGSTLTFSQGRVNVSDNFNILNVFHISTLAVTSGTNIFSGSLSGTGSLSFNLPTNTVSALLGNRSAFNGTTIVSNRGTLLVNNAPGSPGGSGFAVQNTAALGGNGVINAAVIAGTLAPGNSLGTFTISNQLTLVSSSILQYQLGTNSDLTAVLGNLTLNGTLNIANAGGFTNTTYTLFTYGGTLTTNGTPTILAIGSTPDPTKFYTIDISTPGQVNLVVSGVAPPPTDPFTTWQLKYFGCTNCAQAAGAADPDGDGMNNTNEFLAGTDPTNSASAFRITSIVSTGNDVLLFWMTGLDTTNALQATTGAPDGGYNTNNFTDIFTVTNTLGAITNYLDAGSATNQPARYYRVRLVP
jgi:polygalacturonase